MTRSSLVRRAGALLISCACTALGCGGSQDTVSAKTAADMTADQIDADPIALLPSAPLAVAQVDARAFYASSTLGPQLARLTERLMPIGEEAGFRASRDVDKVLLGAYSAQGADVSAVILGRFDEKKLDELAKKNTPAKGGGQIVESTYAGRTLYTFNNAGICVLTSHTVLAGTETGIRRALDRIKDGRVKRDVPDWMLDTLNTPGAATALAADTSTQNLANITAGVMSFDWLKGLQKVRVIGNFKEPGMELAGSLTYDTEAGAQAGARGVQSASKMVQVFAMTGLVPRLQGLDVQVATTNVQWKFSVDDEGLRGLLNNIEPYLGPPRQQ